MIIERSIFQKIKSLKLSFNEIKYDSVDRVKVESIETLVIIFKSTLTKCVSLYPDLFSEIDYDTLEVQKRDSTNGKVYYKNEISSIVNTLHYMVNIMEQDQQSTEKTKVFISHGRSKEWYNLQAYLEKDMLVKTLELSQQPNIGRSVIQKLDEESSFCFCAVIVMTGDDTINESEARVRENVMHEIGFFQGKIGLDKVILLHEHGVNIPSNISGLVYIPFPKNTIEATFGLLLREINAIKSKI